MNISKNLLTVTLAIGMIMGTAAPAAAQATWTLVPSPNAPGSNELLAVAGADSGRAWAVGRTIDYAPRPPAFRSVLLQWTGTAWVQQAHPGFAGNHSLDDVDAPAANDAWAVGSRYEPNLAGRTLVEHWDGTRWSVVTSPSPNPNGNNHLSGVKAVPSDPATVWAVGSYSTPGSSIGSTNLILRRTAGGWRQFTAPATTVMDTLEAVDATGPADAWAVGSGFTHPFGGSSVAITLRWNGTRWTTVPVPQPSPVMLFGVEALAPDDVWAVGHTYPGGPFWIPVILHWNGAAWSRATIPALPSGGQLRDVVALSPTNVYAVGSEGEGTSGRSLVLHWDGRAWTRQAAPSPQVGPRLLGAAAVAPATVWGVGFRYDQAAGANRTITVRTTDG
jgi:hypothetical protein